MLEVRPGEAPGQSTTSASLQAGADTSPMGTPRMSIWLEPRDVGTDVGVDAWIATNDLESPMGRRHPSNETLERSLLAEIAKVLGE